ncbi:MAG: LemA family protein [Flavobacteriales bacterium AspAUS03]
MKRSLLITVAVILFLIIMVVVWLTGTYNQLVMLNERIKTQWGQVENAYQRRADLIPNLVNTVQGAAKFERGTLTEVIEARAKATSVTIEPNNLNQEQISKFQSAQDGLNSSLSRLLVTVERYPELKTIQNFSELQSQLEGTENRINVERNRFNYQVQAFNTYRNQFPRIVITGFFSQFNEKGYFKSQAGTEKSPTVNFGN